MGAHDTKAPDAFRTISEVADSLGVKTHVVRFWESKFSQIKPVKRAGGRRYYRPADLELLAGIRKLLHEDGMTIKGVQKILREQGVKAVSAYANPPEDTGVSSIFSAAAPKPLSSKSGLQTRQPAPKSAPAEESDQLPLFSDRRLPERLGGEAGPKIAPLPGADVSLTDALSKMSPGTVDQDIASRVLAQLIDLRTRIDAVA